MNEAGLTILIIDEGTEQEKVFNVLSFDPSDNKVSYNLLRGHEISHIYHQQFSGSNPSSIFLNFIEKYVENQRANTYKFSQNNYSWFLYVGK